MIYCNIQNKQFSVVILENYQLIVKTFTCFIHHQSSVFITVPVTEDGTYTIH